MVAAELTFASALRKAGGETEKHPIGETPILGGALAVCSFFFPHHLGGGGGGRTQTKVMG